MFGNPIILGLTATPPDPEDFEDVDVKRYEEFFGPVDYEVPVPALVVNPILHLTGPMLLHSPE